MRERIRKLRSDERIRYFVVKYIDSQNAASGLYASAVTALLGVLMLIRILFFAPAGDVESPLYIPGMRRFACTVLIAASAVMFIGSHRYRQTDRKSHAIITVCLYSYIVAVCLFGELISTFDVITGQSFLVFIITEVWVVSLFYVNPLVIVTIIAVSVSSFFAVLCTTESASVNAPDIVAFGVLMAALGIIRYMTMLRKAVDEKIDSDARKQLEIISLYDELTQLKNRHTLNADIDDFAGRRIFVMISDIDNFKHFNDTYSHDMGDDVLRTYARLLRKNFGEYCYRYGGDEFLSVIIEPEENFEMRILQMITDFRNATVKDVIGMSFTGGFVCGIVSDKESFFGMIRLADKYLYDRKYVEKGSVAGSCMEDAAGCEPGKTDVIRINEEGISRKTHGQ